MNELVQHIKVLLLTHNHVALPQFGTFFTDRSKACRIEEDVFAPVRCSLYFVSEIDDTDKSLVKSFMQTHKMSEEQAERHLDKLLAAAGRTLATTGMLDFDILGTFNLSGGRISFSPCKAGLIVPAFYGLDAVGMPLLPVLASRQNQWEHESNAADYTSSSYVIKLNRSVVHYAASIAAAVLLFFLFNTPLGYDTGFMSHKADLTGMLVPYVATPNFEGMGYETAAICSMVQDDSEICADTASALPLEKADSVKADAQCNITETPAPKARYTIVLASSVSEKGASNYVENLHSWGYNEARIIDNGKMIRVVYGAFDTEEQARAKSKELKDKDTQFASVWILALGGK